jgi:mitochondrial division protein 1
MTPRMVHAASSSRNYQGRVSGGSSSLSPRFDFNTLARAPLRLTASRHITAGDLDILESAPDLLSTPIPEAEGVARDVSLLKGFQATIPSSEKNKVRRRKTRNVQLGNGEDGEGETNFKRLGMQARGLLTADPHNHGAAGAKRRASRKQGDALAASKILGKEELNRQRREILQDKENLHVRQVRAIYIVPLWFV